MKIHLKDVILEVSGSKAYCDGCQFLYWPDKAFTKCALFNKIPPRRIVGRWIKNKRLAVCKAHTA